MRQIKDAKLKNVAGGTETGNYKYVFCIGDYVYTQADRGMHFTIEQNISTNNGDELIKVLRHSNSMTPVPITDDDFEYKRASRLLHFYNSFGGNLQGMK